MTTGDTTTDESLTRAIAEIFQKYGFVLPSYITIAANGSIVLRPIHEGHGCVIKAMQTCH